MIKRLRNQHRELRHLPSGVRRVERNLRERLVKASEHASVAELIEEAITQTLREDATNDASAVEEQRQEFDWLREELKDFQFASSRPYFTLQEDESAGEGGLLSITVNPYTCKGCMACVEVCDDDALRTVSQTPESIDSLRRGWGFWQDLPTTPRKYLRVDDLEEGIGALETILLDKRNYTSLAGGDGACLGCGEKSVVHLFTATLEALMQPRVERHVAKVTDLIDRLSRHVEQILIHEVDVGDLALVSQIIEDVGNEELTLAGIAERIEQEQGGEPIDRQWLRRITGLIGNLKKLKWSYTQGNTGRGRASAGVLNSTGCSSVWGSTFPFNPYPFPWSNHLFQDAASLALGVFEGHMSKMADGFKAIRMAESELAGEPLDDSALTYFNWREFTDEEWLLCPPVVALGGDGAMFDIGFQNLSRAMMSGKPIKVLILDTQVYSNTGGQACTSGFFGQISDMAQYGKSIQGKQEVRKEIGLIGMAHRTTYVMQSSISNPNHLIEGFIEGLKTRRPAMFALYTPCQPEHGIGDDMSAHQAKLAVESRAFPLFRYNPDEGQVPEDCFDLSGNPAIEDDWPVYTLTYQESGRQKSLDLPLTFADFAATEMRFRKHFRVAAPETWNDGMIPLAEFLDLDPDDREGRFPYIWSVSRDRELMRLLVGEPIVESCLDRRQFWTMLRSIAGEGKPKIDQSEIESRLRRDLAGKLAAGLTRMMSSESGDVAEMLSPMLQDAGDSPPVGDSAGYAVDHSTGNADSSATNHYMPPWIDSTQCTACGECMQLNPKIFAYNEQKKAIIKDPLGGPYKDLVKAAERCTAKVIHPGLPKDRSGKGIEKLIARGEKYNR